MPNSAARRARLWHAGAAMALTAGLTAGLGPVVTASAPATPATPLGAVVGLRAGSYGESVRALQRALTAAGIVEVAAIDGYFGSATESAIREFQRANGLGATGVVSARTANALGLPTMHPAAPGDILGPGSTGQSVRQLQQRLISAGFPIRGGADGVFGAHTAAALRAFQRAQGYKITGMTNPATMKALGLTGATASARTAASGAPIPWAVGMGRGARGSAVKNLQQALMNSGINVPGGTDGIFGTATEGAVKAFQQARGLATSGVLDDPTARLLGLNGYRAPGTPAPAPAPTPPPAPTGGLQLGSRGAAVTALQQKIISFGWSLPGGADGVFGSATQSRVILFQRSNGLPATGIVDDRTARALGLNRSTPTPTPTPTPGGGGPTANGYPTYDERGARVVALQNALINAGLSVRGGADGVYGSSTAAAIQAFQRARGLLPTGKLDAATASALGLSPAPPPPAGPQVNVVLEAKPVQGPCDYRDSWLAPRSNGRVHLGTDIIAREGNALYAVAAGRISQIYRVSDDSLSGNALKITKPDGTYFFYGHLSAFAAGIDVGSQVNVGQVVGYVGKTGYTLTPHLHIEVHPGGGAAINPYPLIRAIGAC
ncbi:MAG: peptidoglycan-binding protein [Ilumatobacteraceae bacterium]